MPSGGVVTIEIGRTVFEEAYALEHFEVEPGTYVMLAVADTGVGMDRETREHVFEPFFTTKAQGEGTGLGLATIYGIVSQAGGHIWLYSEPGQGSSFKLYFPDVDEAPAAAPEPAPPTSKPASGTILLVEDEVSVRDMTTIALERAGYEVLAVPDGQAALAELAAGGRAIDILVTDVVMPGMSGMELADRVLADRPGTAVVLLSGYTAEILDLDRLLARGARFVSKPVASGELLRSIAEAREATGSTASG
jgi:CheY-like chemotaxis protein